jgi:long-chain acyl-CoA synthetase
MENSAEIWAALLAALWAGRWVLPVSAQTRDAKLRDLIDRLGVTTVVAETTTVEALRDVVHHGISRHDIALGELGCSDSDGDSDTNTSPGAADGSLLLESSGTTGAPKVLRRHLTALLADGHHCRVAVGLGPDDVMLAAVPLYHSYGIDHAVLAAVLAGCRVDIMRRFDPHRARAALEDDGITVMPAVPLMLDVIVKAGGPGRAPSLRHVFSAGSPLPERVEAAFAEAYGVHVGQIYGASEFGSVTFNDPSAAPYDPTSVGRPMGDVEVRILDSETPRSDAPLAPGVEGQVAIKAGSMMAGCLNDALAPDERGFLLSGDLGRLDGDGRLYITGRIKLLIDVAGLKVNPLEVEAILGTHPAVADVVVIPVPYSDVVSRLRAVVIPQEGKSVSKRELQELAAQHLTPYKVPRFWEITRDVPRSPTGKILRRELMARYSS